MIWLALLAALLLASPALADMYPDASNATPAARTNLGIVKNVTDFGAKCDAHHILTSYYIAPGGTTVTLDPVTATAQIAGNVMNVTAVTANGPFQIGQRITGTGIAANTRITGYGTGTGLGTGTYTVVPSQSASPTTITAQTEFRDVGVPKTAVLPGHGAGGNHLYATLTPTNPTTATLSDPSVPGTPQMFVVGLLSKGTGSGYKAGDTITLAGGTLAGVGGAPAIATVQKTYARTASIAAGGSGGTDGTHEVYGVTGNGMRFVGNLTVAGGIATGIAITDGGHYTTNPTVPAAMATAALGVTLPAGATLTLTMDVDLAAPLTPGLYSNGGIPAVFTQASTTGSGTGATFDAASQGYNVNTIAYGTDDSAAFNKALNPDTWDEPQTGAVIELPPRPCAIASTVTRYAPAVELRGTSAYNIAQKIHTTPQGSTLQWLGPVGGTMFQDLARTTAGQAYQNKTLNIGFGCAIPTGISPGWSIPSAGIGIDARAQEMAEYGYLSFDACSKYDMYVDGSGTSATGDFRHANIHDITFQNPHYSDGVGLYHTSTGTVGTPPDADYARVRNIWAIYRSAPVLYFVTTDNLRVEDLHAFKYGTQNVYALDFASAIYGGNENPYSGGAYVAGVSATSIMRGLESSALPVYDVIALGVGDIGNGIAPMARRPGSGRWTRIDGTGRFSLAAYTVATLPACDATNRYVMLSVSDLSVVPTYRGALTGGGAIPGLAFCNGTAWEAH